MKALLERYPSLPYVVPFVVFIVFLVIGADLPGPDRTDALIRVSILTLVIVVFAWPVLSFRLVRPVATSGLGVLVFLLWILPDQLVPGYRDNVIFQNSVVGKVESSMGVESRTDWLVLSLRFARAAIIVPIVEELFWRAWLPRWIDRMDNFRALPLGHFTRFSFVATAVLFALEHGSFWDVGLAAGVIYNWWMVKTKSLGDLIWCHAVTNACLAVWVLAMGAWHYW